MERSTPFVGTRCGNGVDNTTGRTTKFGRVTTSFDFNRLVHIERYKRPTKEVVEVGEV